jgi:hypothetical protein
MCIESFKICKDNLCPYIDTFLLSKKTKLKLTQPELQNQSLIIDHKEYEICIREHLT